MMSRAVAGWFGRGGRGVDHGDVGFGLGCADRQRRRDADLEAVRVQRGDEQPIEPGDRVLVRSRLGAHVDEEAVDEFHARVLVEHAGLDETAVLVG
jgi:hypothetical protein